MFSNVFKFIPNIHKYFLINVFHILSSRCNTLIFNLKLCRYLRLYFLYKTFNRSLYRNGIAKRVEFVLRISILITFNDVPILLQPCLNKILFNEFKLSNDLVPPIFFLCKPFAISILQPFQNAAKRNRNKNSIFDRKLPLRSSDKTSVLRIILFVKILLTNQYVSVLVDIRVIQRAYVTYSSQYYPHILFLGGGIHP